jgi:hypothetical protein
MLRKPLGKIVSVDQLNAIDRGLLARIGIEGLVGRGDEAQTHRRVLGAIGRSAGDDIAHGLPAQRAPGIRRRLALDQSPFSAAEGYDINAAVAARRGAVNLNSAVGVGSGGRSD